MNKLKLWNIHPTWEEAEQVWDAGAAAAAQQQPIKGLKKLPVMEGIKEKNLKWKSLKWMVTKDHQREVLRGILKHPFRYAKAFFKSILKSKPYKRDGDFFLYGLSSLEQFEEIIQDQESLLVVGFSYCHKPFECPAERFSAACIHDPDHPVCRQCFIGKAINALPEKRAIPLVIPTVHYIGGRIFDIVHQNPGKRVLFIITACEMTLEMFGDWGNMVGIQGIGVRLDGRICNTMKAFELSEQGIKPGLTVLLSETQETLLALIRKRRNGSPDACA
jgi:hypothetical protein